ncbi:MAG: TRAP transporter substrate-binding protein [Kiloniellaceae bacterium]
MTRPIRIKSLAAAATATLMLAGAAGTFGAAQAAEWRGWNIHVPEYSVSLGMDQFTAEIAEKSGGRLTGKTYHSGVLGNQPDAIEQMRLGSIDFAVFNLGPMGQVVPATNVVNLPFIFKGLDHMHRVVDGPVGQQLSDAMAEKGLVALAWYDSGARSFYNARKPIATPDDVKGMKVRVMNNDLFVDMISAMGGNATPMAFSEVYSSIKTGVVDGAENNWPSYDSTGHYEVAGYYSGTEHLIIPECFCVSKTLWDSLSAEDKEIVATAARNSADFQRDLWAKQDEASRAKVLAAGAQYNEIADKGPFQAAMKPVYDKFIAANPDLDDLVKAIQAVD